MNEPSSLPEGTVVASKLRVVRLLGVGGMGSVYEVEHEFTKHRRALKLLHHDMLSHPTIIARFLREASAAGHIGNPHIVETFDAGTLEGGEPYIVMEMLEGETLDARLERLGRIPVGELANLIGQACEAVEAAHATGIVHRDLKPENLFLIERAGRPFVKVLDFGISKFDAALTGTKGTTNDGATLGTPYYMSPEQVDGERDLDARADVYALGVILYECAAGERPFDADTLPKLSVLIHAGKHVPLLERDGAIPAAFADIVERAMARNRDDRFASAHELGMALAPFGPYAMSATLPEGAAPPRARSDRPVSLNPPGVSHVVLETPSTRHAGNAEALALNPTMAGTAVSVVDERSGRAKWIMLAAASALVAAGVFATRAGSHPRSAPAPSVATTAAATATTSPAEPPPSAPVSAPPVVPPPSAIPVTPKGLPAPPSAVAQKPPAPPAPKASGTTRAERGGLANDNPYK